MQGEATATRQALLELLALLEDPADPPLGCLRESARRCAVASQALRARECEVARHAEQVLQDLHSARRTNAEVQWQVISRLHDALGYFVCTAERFDGQVSGAREEAVALGVNLIAGGSKRVAEGLCQVCVAACNSSAYRSFCLLRALPINSMPSPAVVGALHAQPCIPFAYGLTPRGVVLQVREQDMSLMHASARLEALSFRILCTNSNLQKSDNCTQLSADNCTQVQCPLHDLNSIALDTGEDNGHVASAALLPKPSGPSSEGSSGAHRFYLQLKEGLAKHVKQHIALASPAPLGANSSPDLGASPHDRDASADEVSLQGMLASLRAAVSDSVAGRYGCALSSLIILYESNVGLMFGLIAPT